VNRKIKFKGKYESALLKIWAKGSLLCLRDGRTVFLAEIRDGAMVETNVAPNTIGQYIGLLDKNGEEIYEGDIIEARGVGDDIPAVVRGEVEWDDNLAGFMIKGDEEARYYFYDVCDVEVVSNVHETEVAK